MNKHILLLLFAVIVSACSRDLRNVGSLAELEKKPPANSGEYRILPGDILEVHVWGENKLSGKRTVNETGKFSMPLIDEVTAEGKTAKELGQEITNHLKDFVPEALVTVSVIKSAPVRYFLSGQFIKPGEFSGEQGINFLQAVASGGGFAPFADESSIILIRQTPEGEIRYELDYNLVVEGRQPNPELKNGDVIAVQ